METEIAIEREKSRGEKERGKEKKKKKRGERVKIAMAEIHRRPTSHDALMAAEYLIATSESLAEARSKDDVGDGGSHEVDRRKATEDERREKGRKRESQI